ncbi:leukosialin [Myotis daubentonii]|uniref:leukosialin n=1 Tax=Myotis daubentonii TaxID=98922 RepID=UPI002873825A|nr:leukosialin [Myotis daubentonii]XP_059548290.1 leukosialin [Myotis daubentonii]
MSVVMEMTLLLLFFGGLWAHEVDTESLGMSTPRQISSSLVSNISEASNLDSVASDQATTRVPEENGGAGHQASLPSSAPHEVSSPATSTAASVGLFITDPIATQEVPTGKLSMFQEISNATSDPTVPAMTTLGLHTMAGETMATSSLETSSGTLTSKPPVTMTTNSLETSSGTSGLPVTMTASSLEPSSGTSGLPVTMTASSLEPSSGTSGLPVTMTASSLEPSSGTSGLPVTMTTSSLEPSSGTSGLPVTMTTSSLETSDMTSEPPVTMATSSLETPKETSGSPSFGVNILMTTPGISTNKGSGPSQSSHQKTGNTLVVAVLVALLAVILLLALVLLWRRRQKRRTGALTLNRGGKRNGVADAWAGPARVSDEEAVTTAAGAPGGDKGSGAPEGEGSGRRPTLTTFFGRRKSRRGSLALEELKVESAASLKGEEEPLVGSEDEAVEAPASDGLVAGDVEVP